MEPDTFESARQFVRASPYAWGGMLAILALVYLTAWAGTRLAIWLAAWPLRRYMGDSWTEKARRAWPSRRIGRVAIVVLGLPSMIAFSTPLLGDFLLPSGLLRFTAGMLGIIGLRQAAIRNEWRLNPAMALTPRAAWGAWVPTLLVVVPILLVVVIFAGPLPDRMNLTAVIMLTSLGLGIGIYFNWGVRAVLRGLGIIRPGSDRLCKVVAGIAEKTNVMPRGVEQVAIPAATAIAFVLEQKIGVTDAALETLDDDQLAAVCAHEMAHLSEPRRVILARASGAFLLGIYAALMMASARPILGTYGPNATLWGIIASFFLLIGGMLLLKRLGRKMEVRADSHATGWEASPGTYASALERIGEVSLFPAVLGSRRSVHPDLYDRMIEAGGTPNFPRPARPPRWAFFVGLAGLMLAGYLGMTAHSYLTGSLPDALFDRTSAAAWKIGAGGGGYADFSLVLEQAPFP